MKNISIALLFLIMSMISALAQLPDFNFKDMEGESHNLYNLIRQEKLVVLDFYFVGCGACIDVAKRLHVIDEKYGFGTEGLQVLSLEVQNNPLPAIEGWEANLPGTYPVLHGEGPWNYWADNIYPDFGGAFPELALIKGDANNPATDIINVDVSKEINFHINIYDLQGKRMVAEKLLGQIWVNRLPSGTYLLELLNKQNGERIIEKIVIGL